MEVALLILSRAGISLDRAGNDIELESFILNFEVLFEAYLRRVLGNHAPAETQVLDGNLEGKRLLFSDAKAPFAQPDIVLSKGHHTAIVEVKYKERPSREDINQAITYAVCYGTRRVTLAHQRAVGGIHGSYAIGTIAGIKVNGYAFDLATPDLAVEEASFTDTVVDLLEEAGPVGIAA